jgi:serine/threonine-protein kinase
MPDPDPLVGQRVSNYEILRRLGQGGMGVVYLARHVTLERDVAIKFLAGQLSNNQDYVDRFLREARSAAKLNHPNIICVYDAGSQDDVYYFVMEYVEGRDFAHLLKQVKRFPELEAIGHIRKAADAMAYAHQEGIIHRDLKPENLILTKGGEVKVGDLGLAKEVNSEESSLTMSGVVMGTPFYISPEQVRGARDVDSRTDIYSLGATLYHLVTGGVPYRGTSPAEIMSKHLTEPFPWPQAVNAELSEGICRVMYKMMAKDPAERFQSMQEVSQVLASWRPGRRPRWLQASVSRSPASPLPHKWPPHKSARCPRLSAPPVLRPVPRPRRSAASPLPSCRSPRFIRSRPPRWSPAWAASSA